MTTRAYRRQLLGLDFDTSTSSSTVQLSFEHKIYFTCVDTFNISCMTSINDQLVGLVVVPDQPLKEL